MKERPILFSAQMVRALLDGSKTQTRRIVDPQFQPDALPIEMTATDERGFVTEGHTGMWWCEAAGNPDEAVRCRHGVPGDRLWVREAWKAHSTFDHLPPRDIPQSHVWYLADDGYKAESRTRASMHMPRWASRITLEIAGVRVERLQDISEADAEAEGCERLDIEREVHDWKICPKCGGTRLHNALGSSGGVVFDVDCSACDTYVKRYKHLWVSINGAGSWDLNPWVWVVEFKVVPK